MRSLKISALYIAAALIVAVGLTAVAQAQDTPTPTAVPPTATATAVDTATAVPPTATATAVPPTATFTRTPTITSIPTQTVNPSLRTRGTRLTDRRIGLIDNSSPASKMAGMGEIVALAVRQINVAGKNGSGTPASLGLSDVGTVISIEAFVTSGGAAATKALLAETTDYTVAGGDILINSDQSANTLVITYRP